MVLFNSNLSNEWKKIFNLFDIISGLFCNCIIHLYVLNRLVWYFFRFRV